MKLAPIALLAALAAAATTGVAQAQQQPARATIGDVSWLAGTWVGKEGAVTTEERWTTPGGGAMLAVARTINGDRMVEFEYLRIVQRGGGLVYIAQPDGRAPVEFVLTALSKQTATFENPAHDFPKVIQYSLRENGALEATISDGGKQSRTFRFTRQ